MIFRLIHADVLDGLAQLGDESVDAVVTDPPYGLSFMGKDWDHGVPGATIWTQVSRVAKPGAHLLAFGGTRTFHRLACAIEDAGWEIRDCVMWVYGQGFSKGGLLGNRKDIAWCSCVNALPQGPLDAGALRDGGCCPRCGGLAATFKGWSVTLKPAWEPVIVARKPLGGTVAENLLRHGTGALNVDGCRIASEKTTGWGGGGSKLYEGGLSRSGGEARPADGRWPANVVHDGSEEVLALFPQTASGDLCRINRKAWTGQPGDSGKVFDRDGDAGSAARFFYTAKVSSGERHYAGPNLHPTLKPVDLMQWLCRLVTPPGGLVLDPFMGSGSTGVAALAEGFRFVGIDKDGESVAVARRRIAGPLFAEHGGGGA